MAEIYINIIVALALYGAVYLIRSKYSDRVSLPMRRGIYCAGIIFFLLVSVCSFNKPMPELRRIIYFALTAIFAGYLVYKLFPIKSEDGVNVK